MTSPSVTPLERVDWNGTPIAYILRAGTEPNRTTFVTQPEATLQVGYVVYDEGGEVQRHIHRQIERRITGTSEVLVVQVGRCEVDFYNDEREVVATKELGPGDVLVMLAGGHGFRMMERTRLLEIKQGPYGGVDEKVRF